MDDATPNARLMALLTLLKSADEFHETHVKDLGRRSILFAENLRSAQQRHFVCNPDRPRF
jgi:hypothetical protein